MRRVFAGAGYIPVDRMNPLPGRDTVRSSRAETIQAKLAAQQLGVTLFYCGCGVEAHEEGTPRQAAPAQDGTATRLDDEPIRLSLEEQLQVLERRIIEDSLRRNNYRRSETARELGISRVTLYNKMKKLGILPKRRNYAPEPNRR